MQTLIKFWLTETSYQILEQDERLRGNYKKNLRIYSNDDVSIYSGMYPNFYPDCHQLFLRGEERERDLHIATLFLHDKSKDRILNIFYDYFFWLYVNNNGRADFIEHENDTYEILIDPSCEKLVRNADS